MNVLPTFQAAVMVLVLLGGVPAQAVVREKAGNTNALSDGASWVGGVVPGSGDVARWSTNVIGPQTVGLGTNLTFGGVVVADPGGDVTISAGSTLSLAGTNGFDLAAAARDLTVFCLVNPAANQTWPVAAGRTLRVRGGVTGTRMLTLPGPGTVVMDGGATTLGTTGAGNNALAVDGGTFVVQSGTLTLNGNNNGNDAAHVQNNGRWEVRGGVTTTPFYTRIGGVGAGTGTLWATAGVVSNAGEFLMGFGGSGPGVLTLTGNAQVVANLIRIGNTGPGTVNLDGGLLRVNRLYSSGGGATLHLNAGTLAAKENASGNWIESTVGTVQVGAAGTRLDSAGRNVTVGARLTPAPGSGGGLTKLGFGTLTLSASNSYAGPTLVSAGKLTVNGIVSSTATLTVAAGATLSGTGVISGPVVVQSGATLELAGGTLRVGSLTVSSGATVLAGLRAPGSALNGAVSSTGAVSLAGMLSVRDDGGMTTGGVYTVATTSASLTAGTIAEGPASAWSFSSSTAVAGQFRLTTLARNAALEIIGGDRDVSTLVTNLVARLLSTTPEPVWYEVRTHSPTGVMTDFGAHPPGNPWTFTVRHLREGTNFVLLRVRETGGSVATNVVQLRLTLGTNTPVRPRPVPAEVWWGGLSDNWPMTNYAAWPFVQQHQDGYIFHGSGWNAVTTDALHRSLASQLRQFNTRFMPELGGDIPNPTASSAAQQLSQWGGWAEDMEQDGVVWSEFTHDYHTENMGALCSNNPTLSWSNQIAWWTGDLTRTNAGYPYTSGIWRDIFLGYRQRFPHTKLGITTSPVYWRWDNYPQLQGAPDLLNYPTILVNGTNYPRSFKASDIIPSFVNMAGEVAGGFLNVCSDFPWHWFVDWDYPQSSVTNRIKVRVAEAYLQSRHARHTLICNPGDPWGKDDVYYKTASLSNMFVHQAEGGRANRYLYESWNVGLPRVVVPESAASSYTSTAKDALQFIKGLRYSNGGLQTLSLTLAPAGAGAVVTLTNTGDYRCLPALLAVPLAGPAIAPRLFTRDGREVTAWVTNRDGFAITNHLFPGGATNLLLTLDAPALAAATNRPVALEAFWNPQDPLGLVRDRRWFGPVCQPLTDWSVRDIGGPALPGGTAMSSNVITVTSSGRWIWESNDAFRFISRPMTGDCSLAVRLLSLSGPQQWTKAGVMFREGTNGGARNLLVIQTLLNGVHYQYRPDQNGAVSYSVFPQTTATNLPRWLRMRRNGPVFTAHHSLDGSNWTLVGAVTNAAAAATLDVGLAVCGESTTHHAIASFESPVFASPPLITPPASATNAWNEATPAYPFTVGSTTTNPAVLAVTATSSAPGLVPSSNLVLSGAGASRFIQLVPVRGQTGLVTVTLSATHGDFTTSTNFTVMFREVNHGPSLATVAPVQVTAGQTVSLTLSATDQDAPPQTLGYGLVQGPPGAQVHGTNGGFVWRPGMAWGGSTQQVVVRVWDNGTPVLAATQSFAVAVRAAAPPRVAGAPHLSGSGEFTFGIAGDAGPDYIVESSTNLMHWTPVRTFPSATPPMTFTNPGPARAQEFFRVRLGP